MKKPNLTQWPKIKNRIKNRKIVKSIPENNNFFYNFLILSFFLIVLFLIIYFRYKEKNNRKLEKQRSIMNLINNVNHYTSK